MFIKQGLPYRMLGRGIEQENVVVEVWLRRGVLMVVNYYNLCQILDLDVLERVEGQDRSTGRWCGDLKAHHNKLWGGMKMDK